jgi:hypothetical protein
VTLEEGFDAASNKPAGDVGAQGLRQGKLRHRGWRAASFQLPKALAPMTLRSLLPPKSRCERPRIPPTSRSPFRVTHD